MRFPKNKLSLLVSKPGIGKTSIILRFLSSLAMQNIKSLYLSPEEQDGDLKEKLNLLLDLKKDLNEEKIDNNLFIDNTIDGLFYETSDKELRNNETFDEICDFIKKNNIEIVILDPIDYFSEQIEKDNEKAVKFQKLLINKLIKELGVSVVMVHHLSKIKNKKFEDADVDDIRGSSTIATKARFISLLYEKERRLFLKTIKSNVSSCRNETIELEYIQRTKQKEFF